MKKILLTGKEGQVGWELQRTLASLGKVWAFDRTSLDLQDFGRLSNVIREIKPDLIVNAAAYTAVDKAENEQEAAHAVNAVAPGIMAEEGKKCGAILVHYSTDYVFDGVSKRPYLENDRVSPQNVYGKTKLQGELAIQTASEKHLILRTSWVYGTRGKNFLLTMLRLGKEKEFLKIVNDQFGAPTWSRLIADATAKMIFSVFQMPHEERWGVYHMTSRGQTSWFDFAQEIFRIDRHIKGSTPEKNGIPKLLGIPTEEYPLPAIRPQYSVLSNEKLYKHFQIQMPEWNEALNLCMS